MVAKEKKKEIDATILHGEIMQFVLVVDERCI